MSDDREKTKANLLDELESIKSLLQTDNSNPNSAPSNPFKEPNCTISEPTLNSPKNHSSPGDMPKNHSTSAPGVLPGQQSLFEVYPEAEPVEKPAKAAIKSNGDHTAKAHHNPFLAEISKSHDNSGRAVPPSQPVALEESEIQRQIDEIIAAYLPKIEAELREKLRLKLTHLD